MRTFPALTLAICLAASSTTFAQFTIPGTGITIPPPPFTGGGGGGGGISIPNPFEAVATALGVKSEDVSNAFQQNAGLAVALTHGPGAGIIFTILTPWPGKPPSQTTTHVPPTPALAAAGRRFSVTLDADSCIVQGTDEVFFYSKRRPSFWAGTKAGDVVTAKAPKCAAYDQLGGNGSVTDITIQIGTMNANEALPDDGTAVRYITVGRPFKG